MDGYGSPMTKIYFDGGCKPNPGAMEYAVVSPDLDYQFHEKIQEGTNNMAEWIGFLVAVEIARMREIKTVEILGDSNLVISQAKGLWKVKAPELITFHNEWKKMKGDFDQITLTHVPRAENLAGIYIESLYS
jgi:ribonuclease HI